MTSPISSPQNIFAIERMSLDGAPPSWLSWFAVALPVALVCDLICWAMILLVYRCAGAAGGRADWLLLLLLLLLCQPSAGAFGGLAYAWGCRRCAEAPSRARCSLLASTRGLGSPAAPRPASAAGRAATSGRYGP
jgi:hypothetical protein